MMNYDLKSADACGIRMYGDSNDDVLKPKAERAGASTLLSLAPLKIGQKLKIRNPTVKTTPATESIIKETIKQEEKIESQIQKHI